MTLSETLCRLVQMKEREEKAEALRKAAAKPFARSLADVDTELNLRGGLQVHVSIRQPGTRCRTCPCLSQGAVVQVGQGLETPWRTW